jgi:hypothetical protein
VAVGAVVAGALAAPHDPGLEALLGRDGAVALREALLHRARVWARAVGGELAFEVSTFGAAAAALHGHDGPVVLVAPDVPALDEALARDAIGDVTEGGCDVALGAAHDGRPYVVAVRSPALLEGLEPAHRDDLFAAVTEQGLSFGFLRSERRLASAQDVTALALDPLAPAELVPLLRARPA